MKLPALTATLPPRIIRLRDGRDYRLRPLGPDDAPRVSAMFATLSPETIRARYGYLIHDMTPERAHRLVDVDRARELPLGIFALDADGRETQLQAMGRLVHAPDNQSAECAFLVHDAARGRGMASRLLQFLRVLGRRRGLPRLFAQVRRENRAMLDVFVLNGARLHFDTGGDIVEVDIPLRLPPPRKPSAPPVLIKKTVDKPPVPSSAPPMDSTPKKGFSVAHLALDLLLVSGFFTFFYYVLQKHVASNDPRMVRLWATLAAACMSGVFWLALQMGRTVFGFQRSSRH